MKRSHKVAAAIAAVTVALTGSGIAYASIPDESGMIHTCLKDGKLRVIDTDAGQTCAGGETSLNWNQTGPAGATGPTGPVGPTGPPGPTGSNDFSMVNQDFSLQPNELKRVEISCPAANQAVLSGGWSQGDDNVSIYSSFPKFSNPNGIGSWVFDLKNKTASLLGGSLYVVCEYREHH